MHFIAHASVTSVTVLNMFSRHAGVLTGSLELHDGHLFPLQIDWLPAAGHLPDSPSGDAQIWKAHGNAAAWLWHFGKGQPR